MLSILICIKLCKTVYFCYAIFFCNLVQFFNAGDELFQLFFRYLIFPFFFVLFMFFVVNLFILLCVFYFFRAFRIYLSLNKSSSCWDFRREYHLPHNITLPTPIHHVKPVSVKYWLITHFFPTLSPIHLSHPSHLSHSSNLLPPTGPPSFFPRPPTPDP